MNTKIIILAAVLLPACAEVSGVIQASRDYCNHVSETKQDYIDCMDRETRWMQPNNLQLTP